ncbi:zinc-binding alcohol dehydrogenase domain-containing protein 2 [Platysternon megacephalum]|uniref:Zinc-binding alcohol dehydrogenase domain-containing protein 2 n=1 Tax=Platysternon megacephalum TaxID=55544 RepID=A0A4D9ETI7_9SAUR|nr:zinc-binding alcohol dehydrogenase domain-containing protein 2 [Platysternon megacephalum]
MNPHAYPDEVKPLSYAFSCFSHPPPGNVIELDHLKTQVRELQAQLKALQATVSKGQKGSQKQLPHYSVMKVTWMYSANVSS